MSSALEAEMMSVTQAKTQLPNRVSRLMGGEIERVVLVKRSSPVAVILTVKEYERLREMDEKQEEVEDLIAALKAKAQGGNGMSLEELSEQLGL